MGGVRPLILGHDDFVDYVYDPVGRTDVGLDNLSVIHIDTLAEHTLSLQGDWLSLDRLDLGSLAFGHVHHVRRRDPSWYYVVGQDRRQLRDVLQETFNGPFRERLEGGIAWCEYREWPWGLQRLD